MASSNHEETSSSSSSSSSYSEEMIKVAVPEPVAPKPKVELDEEVVNVMGSSAQLFAEGSGADYKSSVAINAEASELPDYYPSKGLTTAEANELLAQWGRNELVEKIKPKWLLYLEQLIQPMPCMIWVAIIVECIIMNWLDLGILLVIQFVNATIGWYELTKAGDAVAALKSSLKPQATIKRDGKWENLDAAICVPGDLVLLGSGSAIPADCVINEGRLEIDTSCMTGESLPITANGGDKALMGATAVRGEVEATVVATGMHTFFGTTASMLNVEEESSNLQKNLMKLMIVLVAMSLLMVAAVLTFLLIKMGTEEWREVLSFSVVVIVASIPIAIEIVTTATLAIGSRVLSSEGAIVTRLAAIEELAGMNILCSDKTGTLTLNKMVIQEDTPTFVDGYNQYEIIQAAALAAKWHEPPRDALDTLVLTNADIAPLDQFKQIDFLPFDPAIKRTEGTLIGPDGKCFKITKGAPSIIAKLITDEVVRKEVNRLVDEYAGRGIRSLSVARCDKSDDGSFTDWYMLGIFTFLDPPRPDTKETIERALKLGVDVKMLTGDSALIAREVCKELGMGHQVGNNNDIPELTEDGQPPINCGELMGNLLHENDAYAGIFPEHKYVLVEAYRQQGYATGMTGDGVNDAPALKRADVGVAVAGATDAARAAADIVLTEEGLSVLITGIRVAREIFKRIQSFINYRIAATLQLLWFFVIEVFIFRPEDYTMHPEDAATHLERGFFFKLPVLLLMIITVLNDGTLISIGYDTSKASPRPEKWNIAVLWVISTVLGVVACGSSLLLLWMCLDSNNPEGSLAQLGIGGMRYGQIVTAIYLKVSVSDFLTLFSSRTQGSFFFKTAPGWPLALGAAISLFISTMIACFLPDTELDGVHVEGLAIGDNPLLGLWVWIYCILWWFAQDILKVVTFKILHKFDIFGASSRSMEAARIDKNIVNTAGRTELKLLLRRIDEVVAEAQDALVNFKGLIHATKIKTLLSSLMTAMMDIKHEIMTDPVKAMDEGGIISSFGVFGGANTGGQEWSIDKNDNVTDSRVRNLQKVYHEVMKVHWKGHAREEVVSKLKICIDELEAAAAEANRAFAQTKSNNNLIEQYPSFVGGSQTATRNNDETHIPMIK